VENPQLSNLCGEYYSLLASRNLPAFTPDSNSWIKLNEEKLIYSFSISVDWNIERVVPKTRSKEDERLLQESYLNPICVAQLCNAMGYVTVPILYEKYRSRFIKEKLKPFKDLIIPLYLVPRLTYLTRELLEEISSEISDVDDFELLIDDILEEYNQRVKKKPEPPDDQKVQESEEETEEYLFQIPELPYIESLEEADRLLERYKLSKMHLDLARMYYAGNKLSTQSMMLWGQVHIRSQTQMLSEEEYLAAASKSARLSPEEEMLFRRIRELEEIEARIASEDEGDMAQAMFSLFEEG
jgi:hypothetical protein